MGKEKVHIMYNSMYNSSVAAKGFKEKLSVKIWHGRRHGVLEKLVIFRNFSDKHESMLTNSYLITALLWSLEVEISF